MKKFKITTAVLFLSFNFTSYAEEGPVCKKCQLVRDYNEKNPSKYEYYDDYLKDKEAGIAEEIRYEETTQDGSK